MSLFWVRVINSIGIVLFKLTRIEVFLTPPLQGVTVELWKEFTRNDGSMFQSIQGTIGETDPDGVLSVTATIFFDPSVVPTLFLRIPAQTINGVTYIEVITRRFSPLSAMKRFNVQMIEVPPPDDWEVDPDGWRGINIAFWPSTDEERGWYYTDPITTRPVGPFPTIEATRLAIDIFLDTQPPPPPDIPPSPDVPVLLLAALAVAGFFFLRK